MSKKKTQSSRRWLDEHFADPFVREAWAKGLRSRAAFKLIAIQEKDRLIRPGQIILDLGAAPGGWSQVAARYVEPAGKVIALDRLPMDPLVGVEVITGDLHDDETWTQLRSVLAGQPIDIVLCDMAPNSSGLKAVDQPRAMYLAKLAYEIACEVLPAGGSFLVKVFQGAGFDPYLRNMRQRFGKVVTRKPEASRARSRELYLLGRDFVPPCE